MRQYPLRREVSNMDGQPVNSAPTNGQQMSPVPTKKADTLSFPDAMREVINGKKITKLEWGDEKIYGFLAEDGYLKINLPNKLDNWLLRDGDLCGIDYIVVVDKN